MALKFRNLRVSPDDPVDQWGFEGLLAAVERGNINDWRRIARAVRQDPRGKVAGELSEVIGAVEDSGMAALFARVLRESVKHEEAAERLEVSSNMNQCLAESGLNRIEFAKRLGTSQSRLSTYLTGKVVPSAVLLIRARRVAAASSREG